MTEHKNYIACKRVMFYSQVDEDMFFDWISKITCIEKSEGVRDILYLDLVDRPLSYHELKDIIALCIRYKIDMAQLQPLVTEANQDAAQPWLKKIRVHRA